MNYLEDDMISERSNDGDIQNDRKNWQTKQTRLELKRWENSNTTHSFYKYNKQVSKQPHTKCIPTSIDMHSTKACIKCMCICIEDRSIWRQRRRACTECMIRTLLFFLLLFSFGPVRFHFACDARSHAATNARLEAAGNVDDASEKFFSSNLLPKGTPPAPPSKHCATPGTHSTTTPWKVRRRSAEGSRKQKQEAEAEAGSRSSSSRRGE
jgi:hypothetical protein